MGSRRTVLRGGRLGGASGAEVDRGGPVEPRHAVSYWCWAGHESRPQLATDVIPPETWECVICGQPASTDKENPPARVGGAGAAHKTPYEFLMMRRTPAEGEKLLEEALAALHESRTLAKKSR